MYSLLLQRASVTANWLYMWLQDCFSLGNHCSTSQTTDLYQKTVQGSSELLLEGNPVSLELTARRSVGTIEGRGRKGGRKREGERERGREREREKERKREREREREKERKRERERK